MTCASALRARRSTGALSVLLVVLVIVLWPARADAYVGPGAGVAFATTAFALLFSLVLVVFGLLFYPFRMLWRLIRRRRPPRPSRVKRVVLVGLDGLDPDLVKRFMDEGKLPNMARIASSGVFTPLATTYPAMSPVAWSSFATGTHPSKHGIFDFITRDPRTYVPELSSADVRPPRRHVHVGPFKIPLGKPDVRLLRKSRPFWDELGRHGVPSSILRVPITFPAEPFAAGTMLSAMCVPDMCGTQGTFTLFTSEKAKVDEASPTTAAADGEGGRRVVVEVRGDRVDALLDGPPHPFRADERVVQLKLRVDIDRKAGTAEVRVGDRRVPLPLGQYTEWIPLGFPIGVGIKMRGICRMRLLSLEPFRLYVTPVNIDPDSPILPISHPRFFATFLSKLLGRYTTLGLAEDTWALNEGVLDEDAFLEQAWANHSEREAMFFAMLRRTQRGLVTCVFDGTDRIQHMFMRYHDSEGHPAADPDPARAERYRPVIEDTYKRMDEMVGRVLAEVDPSDPQNLVAVISDHGFKTFQRGVNLNSWLMENGYLFLEEGRTTSGDWFQGVDWTRTKAFALGLGGIFLNIEGRESKGIVKPEDAAALADEIAAKLTGLVDPDRGVPAIRRAHASHRIHRGPYADQSMDILVGYHAGWRISWDGARGVAGGPTFSDNEKAWSGDHCIDPELVPGVLIANRSLVRTEASLAKPDIGGGIEGGAKGPRIIDLAPTVLDLFGIPAPRHMDGASLAGS